MARLTSSHRKARPESLFGIWPLCDRKHLKVMPTNGTELAHMNQGSLWHHRSSTHAESAIRAK